VVAIGLADQSMRRDFGDRGWWLDTSELTADTTAVHIAVRLGATLLRLTDGSVIGTRTWIATGRRFAT